MEGAAGSWNAGQRGPSTGVDDQSGPLQKKSGGGGGKKSSQKKTGKSADIVSNDVKVLRCLHVERRNKI